MRTSSLNRKKNIRLIMTVFSLGNLKMFDKLLDKATSPLLLEPDWEIILQLCDIIKSLEVTPKHVIQSIKKKFHHNNPHVILHTLQCLESIVKNCGTPIHKEVAQKNVIETLKELVKNGPEQIRNKILELIQCWSYGLGQQYQIFIDTFNQFKLEHYHFSSLKQSEAMFENKDVAPEWKDDKKCFRCRQLFTTFTHKHHCRACGNIFCNKCSSKYCPLPKFGFDHYVRVCESCYEKLKTEVLINSKPTPVPSTASSQMKSQAEIDEEKSLQFALAISQSEANEKERQKKMLTQKYATTTTTVSSSNNPKNGDDDFISDKNIDQFTILVTDHINHFKFRMLSNQQRHRNITSDTIVQSVFVVLQHLHPELSRFMQLLEDKQTFYENLQDKLSQLKDAREALNALRSEHYEHKQQEALEHERQRQIQLAQKLDVMRQKKQEYVEYQRQIHLQHLVQQEMEMKNHLEYQRQLTLAREQCSQNSHLINSSLMAYPPNIDTQFSSIPYTQQSVPMINGNKSESQMILLD